MLMENQLSMFVLVREIMQCFVFQEPLVHTIKL